MRAQFLVMVGTLGLFIATAPVLAHHSFNAEYDGTKPITLKGTVTKMEWINPHAWITMDVKGPDGKVTTWRVAAGAPHPVFPPASPRGSPTAAPPNPPRRSLPPNTPTPPPTPPPPPPPHHTTPPPPS